MTGIRDIARSLARDALGACQALDHNGKIEGHEWVLDPGAGKIKVQLTGDKAGLWSHFGGDGAGDLLDLYVKLRGGTIGDALDWARGRLGLEKPAFQGSKPREYRKPDPPAQMRPVERSAIIDSVSLYLRQERGIAPEVSDLYRIAEAPHFDGQDKEGKPKRWPGPWILFPYLRPNGDGKKTLINIKWLHLKRRDGKKVMIQERDCEPGLFGWQACAPTARCALILEGELDAVTAHQYMAELGHDREIACFSVPAGCGRGEKQAWIEREFDRLERFEDIVLCFDEDKEGRNKQAMEEIVGRLGLYRCRVMRLPHKDTNEAWVQHGMPAQDYYAAWRQAKPLMPDELRSASEYAEEVVNAIYPAGTDEPGWPLPWGRMKWVRIRRKELSVWTGWNGSGKSSLLNQVTMHLCDLGERACIASFEMPAVETLRQASRQLSGQRQPHANHVRAIHRWFDDRLWIVDRLGTMDLKRLIEVLIYARRRFGVAFFVVDSFLRLGIDGDDYNAQKAAINDLIKLADTEDCHVALVAHSRKGKDTSKAPGRMDIKGAGEITDLAQLVFSVWRNEEKEKKLSGLDDDPSLVSAKREEKRADLINKPDAEITVDKQRFGTAQLGTQRMWFDRDSVSFKQKSSDDPPTFKSLPINVWSNP